MFTTDTADDNYALSSDLDLEIELPNESEKVESFTSGKDEKPSLEVDRESKDAVLIASALRDYLFRLQKSPDLFKEEASYTKDDINGLVLLVNELVRADTSLSLANLLELEHCFRLSLKFLNNILFHIIRDASNSNINLNRIFDILDKNSNDSGNIVKFNSFLLENNKQPFGDAKIFAESVNFSSDNSLNTILTLELTDIVWPLVWEIGFVDIFHALSRSFGSIFHTLDSVIEEKLVKTVPNLLKLLNGSFDVVKKIFRITKSLENLIKMNNKTLAGLGKPRRSDDETAGFLFRALYDIFPVLAEHQNQLTDSLMKQLKLKTLHRLSSKILLVAKIDFYSSSKDSSQGIEYHLDMIKAIMNWIENDKPSLQQLVDKDLKPLPIPKDNNYVDGKNKKAKKRAGVKLTKYRQKFKRTGDLDVLQNKLEFGKEETFLENKDQYMDNMEDTGLGMAAGKVARLEQTKKRTGRFDGKKSYKSKPKGRVRK